MDLKQIIFILFVQFASEVFCQNNEVTIKTNSSNVKIDHRLYWLEDRSTFIFKDMIFDKDSIYCIVDSSTAEVIHKRFYDVNLETWNFETYKNGNLVQKSSGYENNGRITLLEEKTWYENSQLFYEFDWSKWNRNEIQEVIKYYQNGEVKEKFYYVSKSRVGQSWEYYENGNVKAMINYSQIENVAGIISSKLVGASFYFDIEGCLTKIEIYGDNLLLETIEFHN